MIRISLRTRSSHRLRWIALILLLGAVLRLHAGLREARFHPDEAYFAGFSMRAALNGDWQLPGNLDKPPLSLYLGAVSMSLFAAQPTTEQVLNFTPRQGELAARLPGVFSGIVLVAVTYRLALALYRERRTAHYAALFVALSPFGIGFSGSAFTDMPMLLAAGFALWFAARGQPLLAGTAIVLAIGFKLQAAFMVPLVMLLLWSQSQLIGLRGNLNALARFAGPFLVGIGLLFVWESWRGGPSLLSLAAANNSPTRLIRADEIMPRLIDWLNTSRGLFGAPTVLVIGAGLITLISRIRRQPRRIAAFTDTLLLTWCVVYFAAHWLFAFDTYDRYWLPLLLPLALIGARAGEAALAWLSRRLSMAESGLLGLVILLSMAGSAWNASEGVMLYDDPQSSFTRLSEWPDVAAFINAQPLGTIVYDHWYGWELDFYLGAWTNKRRVYYPTPQALAEGAASQPDQAPRLFVARLAEAHTLWLEALTESGFIIEPAYTSANLIMYRLTRGVDPDPPG